MLGGKPVEVFTGRDGFPLEGLLGLDVESTYMTDRGQFDPEFRVRTVQFATEDEAWVYDLADPEYRRMAQMVLADPAYTFCSHSNMDVLAVWQEFGIDLTGRNVDTLSLAQMVYTDKHADRDLKTLATLHGMPELAAADVELYEWMRSDWLRCGGKKNAARKQIKQQGWDFLAAVDSEAWPEVFTRYAGLDAMVCRRLVPILVPLTRNPPEVLKKEQWLDTRTNRLQIRGMRVDTEALDRLLTEARKATSEAKSAAEGIAGVNVNGPRVKDWFTGHGVEWDRWEEIGGAFTEKGAPSLAKENLGLLAQFDLDYEARSVLSFMQTQAASLDLLRKTEDVSKRLVVHSDGVPRIHPTIHPHGATTTARMSSAEPNVQNFSKKDRRHRGLFLPEPGHVLISCDFAQVELRVVAALAREEKMIETILSGGDLHQLTVDELAVVGVTITRQTAKIVNFLIVYGGGAAALHAQTGIPLDECRIIINAWRERYPAIGALAKYLAEFHSDGIRTASNRWLPVTRTEDGGARSYALINYLVQSSARELLVEAWWNYEEIHGRRGEVWLPIHDELVLQVAENEVEAAIEAVEKSMTMRRGAVPITAEAVVLLDEHGVSRWMPGDVAQEIAKEKAA